MSTSRFESFLARIYVDEVARQAFLDNPRTEAERAGLTPDEIEALANIDRVGLELFAQSSERKRRRRPAKRPARIVNWIRGWLL